MSEHKTSYDDLRIALMNFYNDKISSHAGYIISLTIAIFAIFFTKDVFSALSRALYSGIFIIALVSFFLVLIVQSGFRILFWSWMGTEVLYVKEENTKLVKAPSEIAKIEVYLITHYSGTAKDTDDTDAITQKNPPRSFILARTVYKHQILSGLSFFLILFTISFITAYFLGYLVI